MSVVVGCPACGALAQVPTERAGTKCKCGGERKLLLNSLQNVERQSRGVTVEEWFAAPKTPRTRGECADGPRPCPHLRCKFHWGVLGDNGCALDDADNGAHTYEQIAARIGNEPANDGTRLLVKQALARAQAMHDRPTRRELAEHLAELVALDEAMAAIDDEAA